MKLSTKQLLVIPPHLRLFINQQIHSISKHLQKTSVCIPQPYFPTFLLESSFFRKRFMFIQNIQESIKNKEEIDFDFYVSKYFTLPLPIIRRYYPLLSANAVLKTISKNNLNCDIIHGHRIDLSYAGALLNESNSIPFVLTTRGTDAYEFPYQNKFFKAISRKVIRFVDHAIAVSKNDAQELSKLGMPSKRITVIPNGFDESLFHSINPQLAREKLSLPQNKKILLCIGTLWPIKGHIYLLNALQQLSRNRKDFITFIVGSGPLQNAMRRWIEMNGLQERIVLVGQRPHEEIPLWMNACNILVLPSLNEGFPNVIPEAFSCGIPVVGTKVGGIPDAITNREVGILVEARSARSLLEGIDEALSSNWNQDRILSHSQKFSLRSIVDRTLEVYTEVLR